MSHMNPPPKRVKVCELFNSPIVHKSQNVCFSSEFQKCTPHLQIYQTLTAHGFFPPPENKGPKGVRSHYSTACVQRMRKRGVGNSQFKIWLLTSPCGALLPSMAETPSSAHRWRCRWDAGHTHKKTVFSKNDTATQPTMNIERTHTR